MTFGERIYKIRNEKGLTQDELAAAVGYKSRSTIAKIESGERDAPQTMIVALAKALGTTPSYLMGWEESNSPNVVKDSIPYTPENMVPIPVIGRVAAGYTCLAETDIECYELVSPENINDGYDYVYLKVIGNSMEPLIIEGDLVLVRIQERVNSGDYAVVIVDEEDGVVKQVKFDDNSIQLVSKNPYYPPRVFKGKEKNRIRIFGKVVESKRKFF
jgi:repressor LexA